MKHILRKVRAALFSGELADIILGFTAASAILGLNVPALQDLPG
jgi:hypothetical protein